MLQDIRKSSQGTAAKVIIGLIVISFAGFGLQSILLDGGGGGVGEVNGESITPNEFNQALNTFQRRLGNSMGENFDPELLDPDRLKPQVIDSLVTRKLLVQSARAQDLAISEQGIGALISSMESFQVDGKFSPDLYRSTLANAGYDPAYFKHSLRDDMLINQVRDGLVGSEFATPVELELNTQIVLEQRDIRYLTIPQNKFEQADDPADAEIASYYADNQNSFMTEESVDLDYIELLVDDFREPVSENTLQEAYELQKQDARYSVQNRVSHILFSADSEGDISSRLAQAREELDKGVAFSEVAKKFSDDAGSANSGGDLGFSGGDALPEEMELALAALEIGQVSADVVTDAGIHLMVVTERNDAEIPSFESVRKDLEESIQLEEARVTLLRTVESLRDISFNADDLAAPAEELQLELKKAEGVARSISDGLFAFPALTTAAFSEDVLELGHNSEVMELPGEKFVVLRVRKQHTPEIQELATVRDQIVTTIKLDNAAQALRQEAERALIALRAGESVEQFALSQGYEWQVELGIDRRAVTVPPKVLQRAFDLPEPGEEIVANDIVIADNGDAVVVELVRVSPGVYDVLPASVKQQLQQQSSSELGGLLDTQYQRGLRENAEISVL